MSNPATVSNLSVLRDWYQEATSLCEKGLLAALIELGVSDDQKWLRNLGNAIHNYFYHEAWDSRTPPCHTVDGGTP